MSAALVLLGVALIVAPGPLLNRARIDRQTGAVKDLNTRENSLLAMAFSLDVLAVCLRSGMPVAAAVLAVAPTAPPELGRTLRRAGELLALGADFAAAWTDESLPPGVEQAKCQALARIARRSADSGAALAEGIGSIAQQCRQDAVDAAVGAAERAGVLVGAPLGLCFLPSFVCLGIVPVVMGLAADVFDSGVL